MSMTSVQGGRVLLFPSGHQYFAGWEWVSMPIPFLKVPVWVWGSLTGMSPGEAHVCLGEPSRAGQRLQLEAEPGTPSSWKSSLKLLQNPVFHLDL